MSYHQTSNISCTKSPNLNVFHLALQLSLSSPLKPGVKSWMKMWLEQRRQAMLQLHLSDQQFYYGASYIRGLTIRQCCRKMFVATHWFCVLRRIDISSLWKITVKYWVSVTWSYLHHYDLLQDRILFVAKGAFLFAFEVQAKSKSMEVAIIRSNHITISSSLHINGEQKKLIACWLIGLWATLIEFYASNFWGYVSDWWLRYLMWNYRQMIFPGTHWE